MNEINTDQNQKPNLSEIVKAFLTGVFIDVVLLSISAAIDWIIFYVLLVVVTAHLVIGIGLVLYRDGDLSKSESNFIRFGPLLTICILLFYDNCIRGAVIYKFKVKPNN